MKHKLKERKLHSDTACCVHYCNFKIMKFHSGVTYCCFYNCMYWQLKKKSICMT